MNTLTAMGPMALASNLLAIALLVVAWLGLWNALRRVHASRPMPAIAGALTFIIAARVLEPLALQWSGLPAWLPPPSPSPVWVIFAIALAAAAFEEVGRVVGLGLVSRKGLDPVARTWSFALGYAGVELLMLGVGHGQLLMLAQSGDDAAVHLQRLTPEARAAVERMLAELGTLSAVWLLVERSAAVAFQIGFTLLVASAIARRSAAPLAAALGLHLLIDLPAATYQAGRAPVWAVEAIYVPLGLAAAWLVRRRWPRSSRDVLPSAARPTE